MSELLKAEALAPAAPIVKIECARLLQYQRRFDEARTRLDSLEDIEKLSARTRRVHLDLRLQNSIRESEYLGSKEDYATALACLEEAKRIFDAAAPGLLDQRTLANLHKARRNLAPLRRAFRGLDENVRLKAFESWLVRTLYPASPQPATENSNNESRDESEIVNSGNRGVLTNLRDTYGFVTSGITGIFFHKNDWTDVQKYTPILEGNIVEFEIERGERGLRAVKVRLVNENTNIDLQGRLLVGKIKKLETTFGFITSDEAGEIFFHRSCCVDIAGFRALIVGQQVRYRYNREEGGRVSAIEVAAYSGEAESFLS